MIFLYTSLIFCCVSFGVFQARKLELRLKIYSELIEFLNIYKQNLGFVQKEFKVLIKEFLSGLDNDGAKNVLETILNKKKIENELLSFREIRWLQEQLESLGKADEKTEKSLVEFILLGIKTKEEEANEKVKKYSHLSIKLGILVGVLLVVLLL